MGGQRGEDGLGLFTSQHGPVDVVHYEVDGLGLGPGVGETITNEIGLLGGGGEGSVARVHHVRGDGVQHVFDGEGGKEAVHHDHVALGQHRRRVELLEEGLLAADAEEDEVEVVGQKVKPLVEFGAVILEKAGDLALVLEFVAGKELVQIFLGEARGLEVGEGAVGGLAAAATVCLEVGVGVICNFI